jgi:hypothetical protein
MSDMNSFDKRRWAGISVITGWVFWNGITQVGFALSLNWEPGPQRTARGEEARDQVSEMGLPSEITEWMRNLFYEGLLTSVAIQRSEGRWRVHLSLPLDHTRSQDVIEAIERLMDAANLPRSTSKERAKAVDALCQGSRTFTREDALTHWLGGRVQLGAQQIFAFSKR